MAIEIKVPTLGESVTSATVAKWMKQAGEAVKADEPLVELETDKVTVEVPSPAAGILSSIVVAQGSDVGVGAVLGLIEAGAAAAAAAPAPAAKPAAAPAAKPAAPVAAPAPAPAVAPRAPAAPTVAMPSAAKLMAETGVAPEAGTGKGGRITKGDVLAALAAAPKPAAAPAAAPVAAARPARPADPREERVKMTRLRRRIAERLKEAQTNAAMLTTFNEVDMTAVLHLRSQYRDAFEKRHGVRIGFMGFFVRAVIAALKEFPAVNAEIDGEDIIYKNYYDIGVAVGSPSGLVVPVLRDCDKKGLAQIEKDIADFGRRARDGALKLEELSGGTFTISNGGVYGSLMSTPILNPPQSGILGMHKIQERPMAIAGKVEIRPMMYLALSYDHRIIDGKEAVSFLVRVKDAIEDPARLVLEV